MAQDIPAPPEAEIIRLARLAAHMSVDEAVAKVRAAGGRIGPTYWRDVERGHGGRRGRRVPARASEGLLAQMAHAVGGITPAQLTEAGREDAARVLAEIIRREGTTPKLRVVPPPDPDGEPIPPALQKLLDVLPARWLLAEEVSYPGWLTRTEKAERAREAGDGMAVAAWSGPQATPDRHRLILLAYYRWRAAGSPSGEQDASGLESL